jgi:uncharacterized DUF497 family protein
MAEFEWDEPKRISNIQKHGFDFFRAKRMFDGRPILLNIESLEIEIRFSTVARLDGRMATAIWTVRGAHIRFISVRSARNAERRKHRQLHSQRD